jgi:GNAT superfamily N-acetyltransferase
MELQKGRLEDLDALYALFLEVRAAMEKEGNDTWSHDYPLKEDFAEDLEKNETYLYWENGILVAYIAATSDPLDDFFFSTRSAKKLAQLRKDTAMKEDETFLLLHRLMVRPSFQGHGLAEKIFSEVSHRYPHAVTMFAVYPNNLKAIRAYLHYGYTNLGIYPFEYGPSVPCYLFYKRYN